MNGEKTMVMEISQKPWELTSFAQIICIAIIYFVGARLSLLFVLKPEGIAVIWPMSGFFLAALLLTHRSKWLYLVGIIFVVNLVDEMLAGTSVLISLVYSGSDCGEAVLGAWLLFFYIGEPINMARVRDVIGLLLFIVLFISGIMSLIAASAPSISFGLPFWTCWKWWWTSDAVGIILVAPLVLSWAMGGRINLKALEPKRIIETIVLFGPMTVFNYMAFRGLLEGKGFGFLFADLTFPFLIWAALRFGIRGVTTSSFILAALGIRCTLAGYGTLLFTSQSRVDEVLQLQIYLAVISISILILAATVSERQKTKNKLLNANRALMVLSNSNKIITKVSVEPVLLNKICEELVVTGGYRMAWIGFVEQNDGKKVALAAYSGFENGYLNKIETYWTNIKTGTGSTGSAIRNKQPVLCRDISSDPTFGPWYNEAVKRGYHSSVVFPLMDNENSIGVLKIYGSEPDAFDSQEMKLLSELSDDLSYAIISLRNRIELEKKEDELRKNQSLLNETQRIAKVGGWEYDGVTGRISCTDEVYRIYGVNKDSFDHGIIEHGTQFYAPEDRKCISDAFRAAVEKGEPCDLELRLISADGRRLYVRIMGQAEQKDGKVVRVFGNIMDITERKKAEAALLDSNEKLSALIQSSPLAIIAHDPEGNVTLWNPAAEKMFGWKEKEVMGRFLPLVSKEKESEHHALRKRVLSGQGFDNVEVCRRRKDGSNIYVSFSTAPLRDSTGRISGIISVVADITARKRAEDALRESEERLLLFIEHAPAALAMFDRKMRYLAVSRRWMTDYSIGDQNIVGRSHYEIFPEIPERWKAVHRRALKGEVIRTDEDSFLRRDGTLVWQRWEVRPWHEVSGAIGGILIFTEDITDYKQAEEEIKKVSEQRRMLSAHLQETIERERISIAREIHDDLGQTLSALKMDIGWIRKRLLSNQQAVAEKMDSMTAMINRSTQTVKQICTELRPGILDDLGLIYALDWHSVQFQERTGIQCRLTVDPANFKVDDDMATAIYRIFQEALTNVARHAEATRVEASIRHKNNQIIIEINDNGKGIRGSELARSTSFGIVGMRERVYALGGDFVIIGERDKGTRISAAIPLWNRV